MFEIISSETDDVFTQAYEKGVFREDERDTLNSIVKILELSSTYPDADVQAMFAKPSATFKGGHKK